MPGQLRNAVVVITGASSGIGRAAAVAFAREGASVGLAARSERDLDEVAHECRRWGGSALAVRTDVTDEPAVESLAERVYREFRRIDVWINNAGVILYGSFDDIPSDVFRAVIETNLFGQIHGARAVLPYFRRQGWGVLINMDSLWGRLTSPHVSAYVTSKFGVRGFSACLRQGLSQQPDIHVCTILPGSVDTPIFRHAANYTGRMVKPVPPISDPDRVVRAIVECARRPQREVIVGRVGRAMALGQAIFPGVYDSLVHPVFDRFAFGAESVENTTGNVVEPQSSWNQVHGEWRSGKRVALRRVATAAVVASALALVRASTRDRGLAVPRLGWER